MLVQDIQLLDFFIATLFSSGANEIAKKYKAFKKQSDPLQIKYPNI